MYRVEIRDENGRYEEFEFSTRDDVYEWACYCGGRDCEDEILAVWRGNTVLWCALSCDYALTFEDLLGYFG